MPLERCKVGKKDGYRWGTHGKCYVGTKEARKKAIKQGLSFTPEAGFKAEMAKSSITEEEVQEAYEELIYEGIPADDEYGNPYLESVAKKLSTEQRKKIPDEDFAGPNRSFPCHDHAHFLAALRLVSRAPADQQAAIRKKILEIGKRHGWTEEK